MRLIFIPILFTIAMMGAGYLLRFVGYANKVRTWDEWDSVFCTTLLLGVAFPTWLVYLSPHWPLPVLWTLVAAGVAHFSPFHAHKDGKCVMSKRMQYVMAGISSGVGWLTYMMIFCEKHWQ